jgi:hypothetical protein
MNEADWDRCEDPRAMLEHLRDAGASDRKLRLFGYACLRQVWPRLPDEHGRHEVLLGESVEDRLSEDELALAPELEEARLAPAVAWHAGEDPWSWAAWAARQAVGLAGGPSQEASRRSRAALLRDLFGNPFRPLAALDAAWLGWNGSIVGKLAEAAYTHRILPEGTLDNARLSVLADALEDAGCGDTEILGHLRGPGRHVRGCWLIDLLSGRG